MTKYRDLPVKSFNNFEEFYKWLADNHSALNGFWLKYYKKDSGKTSIKHPDAVRAALCWGWIDGLLNKYDNESYVVRFTPRRQKSVWSKINVAHVEDLINQGLMQPAGLLHVDAAKADGRWLKAYAPPSTMTIPVTFITEIKKNPTAYNNFVKLDKANLYAIGYRLSTAHTDALVEKRTSTIITLLNEGKTIHPMKGSK